MSASYDDIFRQHCRAVTPIATSVAPRIQRLPGIRAVLFDVYGTLLISASGDVGTADSVNQTGAANQTGASIRAAAMRDSLQALGMTLGPPHLFESGILESTIRRRHARTRSQGVDYPEVDIVQVWSDVVEQLLADGAISGGPVSSGPVSGGPTTKRADAFDLAHFDFRRLAVEYEARTNPTWPMPEMSATLRELSGRGLVLGIVSNAQFYTPRLFPALAEQSLEALGVDAELQYYSYHDGWAKPGEFMYRRAKHDCEQRGIEAGRVLYVGNDMLNDIRPAQSVGFRTALFAGDRRSLRMREGDDRVADVVPDIVLADLPSLRDCL